MKNDIEIEIKVRVEQPARLLHFLESKAKFIGQFRQTDSYFNAPHRDFLEHRPVTEWLRLRQSGEHNLITYKCTHYDEARQYSQYADEYETSIGDLTAMRNIFGALGFKPLTTVTKTRRIWSFEDYEISMDSVDGLGDFVEVEYKGHQDKSNAADIKAAMFAFLKKLDCGAIDRARQGYAIMMLDPKNIRFERV